MAIFKACLPGKISALPVIISDSFPKATIDPVKVIAPINTPIKTSTLWIVSWDEDISICGNIAEFIPIKTAANPTKEWRAATSWGIPVICTFLATMAPINEPITIAPINQWSHFVKKTWLPKIVATTAITIPTMPYHTALFAFSWLLKPPKARIKSTLEVIYEAVSIPIVISKSFT